MTEQQGARLERGSRARADVRQALLKFSHAHLYPGVPPGEWQPAAVMVDMVLSVRSSSRHQAAVDRDRAAVDRDRVLNERHFQFRGLPSAGTQDDQRRSRLEDRRKRRADDR